MFISPPPLMVPGPKGDPGANGSSGTPGTAATISIGTVTTGAPGTSVTVSNAGTSAAAILNFTIPRGATGTAAKPVQAIRATTNASGAYTWVFPTPFATIPAVAATVFAATTDIYDIKITALSTASVTVQLGRTQAATVALIGLTILSVQATVGAQSVHIIATEP